MAVFPHKKIDPIDYEALPKDARSELLFASHPSVVTLDELNEQVPRYLTLIPFFAIAFTIFSLFYIDLGLFAFLAGAVLAIALVSKIVHQAGMHFVDVSCLNKQLQLGAETKIPMQFDNQSFVPKGLYLLLAFSIAAYLSAYFMLPNWRPFLLPSIILICVLILAISVWPRMSNPIIRRSMFNVLLHWINEDYPAAIPGAFNRVRVPQTIRLKMLFGVIVGLFVTLPTIAFYNPTILLFKDLDTLSMKYPLRSFEFSSLIEAEANRGWIGGIEDVTIGFLAEVAVKKKSIESEYNRDWRKEAEQIASEIRAARKFQRQKTVESPSGIFLVTWNFFTTEWLTTLIATFLSFLISVSECLVVFVCLGASILSPMLQKLEMELAKHDEFANEWQGIAYRLSNSEDPFDQESLFLGYFGD